jgi:hypothetical protein
MSEAAPRADEKVLTALLLGTIILAAIALMREGPQYDNVIEGWRLFNTAFFSGALIGFLFWTQTFHIVPTLSLKPAHRQPWIAAFALALVFTVAGSWLNRSFATPSGRSIVATIDSLREVKDDRWQLWVKHPDGTFQRYQIKKDAAAALQNRTTVKLEVSRGAMGFDLITRFDPEK